MLFFACEHRTLLKAYWWSFCLVLVFIEAQWYFACGVAYRWGSHLAAIRQILPGGILFRYNGWRPSIIIYFWKTSVCHARTHHTNTCMLRTQDTHESPSHNARKPRMHVTHTRRTCMLCVRKCLAGMRGGRIMHVGSILIFNFNPASTFKCMTHAMQTHARIRCMIRSYTHTHTHTPRRDLSLGKAQLRHGASPGGG